MVNTYNGNLSFTINKLTIVDKNWWEMTGPTGPVLGSSVLQRQDPMDFHTVLPKLA